MCAFANARAGRSVRGSRGEYASETNQMVGAIWFDCAPLRTLSCGTRRSRGFYAPPPSSTSWTSRAWRRGRTRQRVGCRGGSQVPCAPWCACVCEEKNAFFVVFDDDAGERMTRARACDALLNERCDYMVTPRRHRAFRRISGRFVPRAPT